METYTVTVTTREVPVERINDLLCCAFEGGSNYWATMVKKYVPENVEYEYVYELPSKGGVVTLRDFENNKFDLTKGSLKKGLQLMSEKYLHHFKDFLDENEDAITRRCFSSALFVW